MIKSVDGPKGKRLPESITGPFDALTADVPPATDKPPARRPLLDLFPTEATRVRRRDPIAHRAERRSSERETGAPQPGSPAAFYGLREKPFAPAADPRFFYHSRPHDAASQQLLTAIRRRDGLVVLTGEAGTGKTTLARVVIEEIDRRTLTSFITNPFVSGDELLAQILCDFGVLSRDDIARAPLATREELSVTLQSFVESLVPLDASAVVIVDAAHDLSADVLEEVRRLCEAADVSSRLQVVLVGQPALARMLRRPANQALQQRIAVRCTLDPLPVEDVAPYIVHRLAAAGDAVRVEFDSGAVKRIFAISRGVPRVVNALCEAALARGQEASAAVITGEMIDRAAGDADFEAPASAWRRAGQRVAIAAAMALFLLLGAAAAAWIFRDALMRLIRRG